MKNRRRLIVLADQGASSLSNVLVAVLVARAMSPAAFGAFAAEMVAFQIITGGIRSVVGEPLLTIYSNEGPRARRKIVSDIHGTALLLAAICSVILVVTARFVGGPTGSALTALAFVLPLLVMQDTWRYLFVVDRPSAALAIDLVWLVGVVVSMPLLSSAGISAYVLAWGFSGAAAALVGTALGWGLPSWPHPWRWLVTHAQVCWRFFAEFLTAQGAGQMTFVGLGAIAGTAALGAARAAWVLYGFLVVVHSALYLILVPEGVRKRADGKRLRRTFLRASAVSMSVSALWMLVVLLMPTNWGGHLFGRTWADAQDLVVPMGLSFMAGGALSGGLLGIRALGDARLSLRARLMSTPVQVILPLAGAMIGHANGFVLGMGLGNALSAVIWWRPLWRATAAAPASPPEITDDAAAQSDPVPVPL